MAKLVPVDNIEDGMILADAIINKMGQTMLPSGCHLKDNHIKILKMWNIRSVTVKSNEDEEDIQLSPELIKLAASKISKRMQWKPRNPVEKDLYKMAVIHLAKNLSFNK